MDTQNVTIKPGLRKLSEDKRDLSLGSIFGHPKLEGIEDFIVATPLVMKDQASDDFCTGYTVTEVSEDQEGIELDPDFQYAASCKIRGSYEEWGMDLRIAFKSGVDVGSLPKKDRPAYMEGKPRNFRANWENWTEECFEKAQNYKKATFFKVDGQYDLFDNIRAAMWQFRNERRTIGVGAEWRQSWTNSPGGVISDDYDRKEEGFGHAFKIFGQKTIDGEIHLMAQLSNGPIGDQGIYYFKRATVNREFRDFGQYMYQDMPRDQAFFYQKHGIQVGDASWRKAWKVIISILRPTYYL